MEVTEHIEILRAEGMALADASEMTGLDAQVPTCPEWTVRDLLRHVGEVHRWARSHVVDSRPTLNTDSFAVWPDNDQELFAWYREGHALLLQALEAADPAADYFGFLPGPRGTRFWARRQAHETTIHRVDAQSVTGQVTPVEPEAAADGIGEILHGFYARRPSRVTSPEPLTFALIGNDALLAGQAGNDLLLAGQAGNDLLLAGQAGNDAPRVWRVTIDSEGPSTSSEDGPADCRVTGTASDLYLLLWNRITLDQLAVEGSPRALDLWREKARVIWS